MTIRRVMVTLDSILDTRVGTLKLMKDSYVDAIFRDGNIYYNRIIDGFDWLEENITEEYRKRYAARDVETLKASFRTELIDHLKLVVANIYIERDISPLWDDISFSINYWPYKLDEETVAVFEESLCQELSLIIDGVVAYSPSVKLVSVSDSELDFPYIKRNLDSIYHYCLVDWLTAQAEAFKLDENQMFITGVEFNTPVLFNDIPDKNDLKKPDGGNFNPFEETKRYLSLWIKINFLHPKMFSLPNPKE